MKDKIHPRRNHKKGNHPVDVGRIEMFDTAVFSRKSTGRQGSECMNQRIKKIHPATHQQQSFNHRHPEIDIPEIFCGFSNPWSNLVNRRPRSLGFDQLQTADAEQRQNGDSQNDDTHTSEPMSQ